MPTHNTQYVFKGGQQTTMRTIKIFVSLPMKGLSNEKIMEAFLESDTQLKELFEGYDIKVMHQTLGSAIPEDEVHQYTHPELYFFGSGIKDLMSKCDIVAFYPGWKVARGCNAEYNLAKAYNIPTLDLESIICPEDIRIIVSKLNLPEG